MFFGGGGSSVSGWIEPEGEWMGVGICMDATVHLGSRFTYVESKHVYISVEIVESIRGVTRRLELGSAEREGGRAQQGWMGIRMCTADVCGLPERCEV